MYRWVGKTWNPLRGKCNHECPYCYVPVMGKRMKAIAEKYSGDPMVDQKALKTIPSVKEDGQAIFVCSMHDLFGENVKDEDIRTVIRAARAYEIKRAKQNKTIPTFLWQSKNPIRMLQFTGVYPTNSMFATTIESNRPIEGSKAPEPRDRILGMIEMARQGLGPRMVSIEPVIDFCPDVMIEWMGLINPEFVSIGADSKGHGLDEPSKEKIEALITGLESRRIQYKVKDNLGRLMK